MHQTRSVAQQKQQQHRTWQRDYRAFIRMCAYYWHQSIVGITGSIGGGGTYTPTHTPTTQTHTQYFMLNIQKHLLKRKNILRMNICQRNLAAIIHKVNTINKFKFDKFSKKKNFRMLHGIMGTRVTSSMMRHCIMMLV
uniref:7-cyano-7-deazaguanine synthase n=1 Tax=Zeugodacus cucurbitae TaxID=28588 RepID=A0A0A1WHN1_ZEUCU